MHKFIKNLIVGEKVEGVYYQGNIPEPKVCRNGKLLYSVKLQDKTGFIFGNYFAEPNEDMNFLIEKKLGYIKISGNVNEYNGYKNVVLSYIELAEDGKDDINREDLFEADEKLKESLLNGEEIKLNVAAITHYDFAKVSSILNYGEIYLEREEENKADKNAVKVNFKDDDENIYKLGYIKAYQAKTFADLMDEGKKFEAEYDELLQKENCERVGLLIKVRQING